MRIDGSGRPVSLNPRASGRKDKAGDAAFSADSASSASKSGARMVVGTTTGIDALLALQAVDDPLFAKRKAVKRGRTMLDVLEDMKADLLAGRLNEGKLNTLLAVLTQAKERSEPELDALIEDIELRARVELAKRGIYTSA